MNSLVEKKIITELSCDKDFVYVLSDNHMLALTEYKVIQSQEQSGLVKCMKMLYNGKTCLYYHASGLKSLGILLPSINAEAFATIIENLFSSLIEIRSNGFLTCRSLDVSIEKIYVNPSDYKVSFVYIPVTERNFVDTFFLVDNLKRNILSLLQGMSNIESAATRRLAALLSDESLSLEEIAAGLKQNNYKEVEEEKIFFEKEVDRKPEKEVKVEKAVPPQQEKSEKGVLKLSLEKEGSAFHIMIREDEAVLGRKKEFVDHAIPFNPAIGRIHCKIIRDSGGTVYKVIDLSSSNGTFLDGNKLDPNVPYALYNGASLRLADSRFKVTIG